MSSSSELSGPPIKRIKQTILSFMKKDGTWTSEVTYCNILKINCVPKYF